MKCKNCDKKTSRNDITQCRACWKKEQRANKKQYLCNTCGKKKSANGTLCRKCWLQKSDKKLPSTAWKKGLVPWVTGREHLPGDKNPNWQGGSIDAIKRMCLIRDDFTCQECGIRDIDIMEVDHIIEKNKRPDLVLELSNMQSLCPNCHKRKTLKRYKNVGSKRRWKERYR